MSYNNMNELVGKIVVGVTRDYSSAQITFDDGTVVDLTGGDELTTTVTVPQLILVTPHIWVNTKNKFFFTDETTGLNGPYDTLEMASLALNQYTAHMNSPHMRLVMIIGDDEDYGILVTKAQLYQLQEYGADTKQSRSIINLAPRVELQDPHAIFDLTT